MRIQKQLLVCLIVAINIGRSLVGYSSSSGDPISLPLGESGEYEVFRLLKDTPPWTTERDPETRSFILRRYLEIAKFSDDELRKGILRFCEYVEAMPSDYRLGERAKLILLNRHVFAVPKTITAEEMEVGTYVLLKRCEYDRGRSFAREPWVMQSPDFKGRYYAIAPLAEDASGALSVVCDADVLGRNFIYTCKELVAEFDYFRRNYGRRSRRASCAGPN